MCSTLLWNVDSAMAREDEITPIATMLREELVKKPSENGEKGTTLYSYSSFRLGKKQLHSKKAHTHELVMP